MSKVEELRAKFSKITNSTFNKFVAGDTTNTKKYLEWMCKIWNDRETHRYSVSSFSSFHIVRTVQSFDSLIPYLEDKDIYSKNNGDYGNLCNRLSIANDIKTDKEFKREGNIDVIFEDENTILLRPLTIDGSLKYGFNTRWCTASKTSPGTFITYNREGYLAYLISKNNNKKKNYNKIAFYMNTIGNHDPLLNSLTIFNQNDTGVGSDDVISNGWDEEFILKIVFEIRFKAVLKKRTFSAKANVDQSMKAMEDFDFNKFYENLNFLKKSGDEFDGYINKATETVSKFLLNISSKINLQ